MAKSFDITSEGTNPIRYVGSFDSTINPYNNTFTVTISLTVQLISSASVPSKSTSIKAFLWNNSIDYWYNRNDEDNPFARIFETNQIRLTRGATPTNLGTFSKTFPLQKNGTTIENKDGNSGGSLSVRIDNNANVAGMLYTLKATNVKKKINSVWNYVSCWIKKNNIWKRCIVWKKFNGVWKK